MKELIVSLPTALRVDYLIDTCFLIHAFEGGHSKQMLEFCSSKKVGMSSFNLEELDHVSHRLKGTEDHHIREFLKSGKLFRIDVPVHPGDREGEMSFVEAYDHEILRRVPDPSDAVLLVLALKMGANILSRDRHHVFTALAENYSEAKGIEILNVFP